MKQTYIVFRGGETSYAAPSAEVYEISVERGFLVSPVINYDEDEGTSSEGSDSEATKW